MISALRVCQRCEAHTKKGVRCQRRTCKYSTYCAQHAKKLFKLEVRKSSVAPGAGCGLYVYQPNASLRDRPVFKKNEIVSKAITSKATITLDDHNVSAYAIRLSKKHGILDMRSTQSGLLRYANSCMPEQRGCPRYNARLSIGYPAGEPRVSLKAEKNLYHGDEILWAYGKQYWNMMKRAEDAYGRPPGRQQCR